MKVSRSAKVALAIAVLGFGFTALERSGWLLYGIDRVRFGSTATVDGVCYAIPSRWTLLPPSHAQNGADFQLHFAGAYTFASLVMANDIRKRVAGSTAIGDLTATGYAIYEIRETMGSTAIPYVALKDGLSVAIAGQTEYAVRDLASRLSRCSAI